MRRDPPIELPPVAESPKALRIGIMPLEDPETDNAENRQLFHLLQSAIEAAGHVCIFPRKTLEDLNYNLDRVASMVSKVHANSWILYVRTREVLEWFIAQGVPVFAPGRPTTGIQVGVTIGPPRKLAI